MSGGWRPDSDGVNQWWRVAIEGGWWNVGAYGGSSSESVHRAHTYESIWMQMHPYEAFGIQVRPVDFGVWAST